jgi:signal transduction histidine kinase
LDACSVDLDYQVLAGQQFEIGGWIRQLLIAATQELTRNAVRHGRATRIEIRMRVSEDAVSYRVEDNGTGFDHRRAVTLGRGLSNLLGRVEDMGGTASVVSKFGASVILIQVPRVVR